MEQWIIINYPLHPVKESLVLFNQTFNCNAPIEGYRKKAISLGVLTGNKHKKYTEEEINYIKLIYPNHSLNDVCKLFEKKFGYFISYEVMTQIAKRHHIKGYRITKEEREWLKRNAANYTYKKLVDLFNITFDRNKGLCAMKALLNHRMKLYCKPEFFEFTKEEDEWLKENYPKLEYSREKLVEMINEKFGNNRTEGSIHSHCVRKGYIKDREHFLYKKGNITWNTGMSKEELKSYFNNESYSRMTSTYKNMPNHKRRYDYEKENGVVLSKDICLTNIGDGELVPVKTKYVLRARARKLDKAGELTKFIYSIYETEDLIKEKKKIKGDNND